MNHGSLFSGIGGFDYAAQLMGWRNVFHCECNTFGQKVLKHYWPEAISYSDICQTDFSIHRGEIDVLSGGFPCQDASNALQTGNGQSGISGKRTGLFFEKCRVIQEVRPKFIVAENVANILKINNGRDFSRILYELSRLGYNAEWRVCYASEVGAPHHRSRLYLVAYSNSIRIQRNESFFSLLQEKAEPKRRKITGTDVEINADREWLCESPVPYVDDGVPEKLLSESIKAAGNAIVPQVVLQIFKAIDQYQKMNL